MIRVPVRCDYRYPDRVCGSEAADHVHQPEPCANGQDARHHDYRPPPYVFVEVAGRRRRLKVA